MPTSVSEWKYLEKIHSGMSRHPPASVCQVLITMISDTRDFHEGASKQKNKKGKTRKLNFAPILYYIIGFDNRRFSRDVPASARKCGRDCFLCFLARARARAQRGERVAVTVFRGNKKQEWIYKGRFDVAGLESAILSFPGPGSNSLLRRCNHINIYLDMYS